MCVLMTHRGAATVTEATDAAGSCVTRSDQRITPCVANKGDQERFASAPNRPVTPNGTEEARIVDPRTVSESLPSHEFMNSSRGMVNKLARPLGTIGREAPLVLS